MNKPNCKRLTAMAFAVMFAMSSGLNVSAGVLEGKGFEGYRLMGAERSLAGNCGHEGEDIPHEEGCYAFTYKVNEKYRDAMKAAAEEAELDFDADKNGEVSDEELIAGTGAMDEDAVKAYASALYGALGDIEPDATTDSSVLKMDNGWWLIAGTQDAEGEDGEPVEPSLMLKTVYGGTVDLAPEVSIPMLTQKILAAPAAEDAIVDGDKGGLEAVTQTRAKDTPVTIAEDADADTDADTDEDADTDADTDEDADTDADTDEDADSDADTDADTDDDSKYEDADAIPSEDAFAGYARVDAADMGAGGKTWFEAALALPDNIEELDNWGFAIHLKAEGLKLEEGLKLYVDGKEAKTKGGEKAEISDGCLGEAVVGMDGSHLTVNGKDAEYTKGSVITLRYACSLADEYVTGGAGNSIEAWAEFSPDVSDPEKTVETVHDKNAVFTYKLDVDSVDGEHKELAGADLALYRADADAEGGWEKVDMALDNSGKDLTTFEFAALSAGTYKLSETAAPAGYAKAEDLIFEIRPEYDADSEAPAAKSLAVYVDGELASTGEADAQFTADLESGTLSTALISAKGAHMPSTGSMGRTILFGSGFGLLLAGGCVYAFSRRKGDAQ